MAWTRKPNREVTPEILARELEVIREANGGKLRPVNVVETATSETHPLHPCFTWDDEKAGHLYRLHEARNLIREVSVEIGERTVAKYWNVPSSKPSESFYRPAEVIVERPDEFQRALQLIAEKMQSLKRSLTDLSGLASSSQSHSDRLALISLAVQAFSAAEAAVLRIQ
jgi:hypothetical protein